MSGGHRTNGVHACFADEHALSDAGGLARFLDTTAPRLLLNRAKDQPSDIALRDKRLGVYRGISWREYCDTVEELALGLHSIGARAGDRICIMGDACTEWLLADLAAMAIGAITVGVYPTSSQDDIQHVVRDSGARYFFAETQEHLDKLLAVIEHLTDIRQIIVIDTRALYLFEHPLLRSFENLRELGREGKAKAPDTFHSMVSKTKPDDPAAIVYTSGTTGAPKGAVLSHRNLLGGVATYIACQPNIVTRPHRVVAHLPLSHVVARIIFVTTPLATRVVPFFCEDVEAFADTIREVAPDFVILPPRFYEKLAGQLLVGVQASSPLKKLAFRLAEKVGARVLSIRRKAGRLPLHLTVANWLAQLLVYRQLLEKIGFAKLRRAFTGSAPMPPIVIDTWHRWGIDLREAYGTTEASGLIIAQFDAFPKPEGIGEPIPLPGFQIKITESGELLVKSPVVFQGYWQDDAATADVLGSDGYYHTGDIVERLPNGHIKLVDRVKDIFTTLGGKTLSPQQIEKAMKGSPYVSEAIVFGDGRRYITALFELDFAVVSQWARTNGIPYTSYTDLVSRPEVSSLIEDEVAHANKRLSRVEQVKNFRIIPIELDPEEGETTATRKIKRTLMLEMFKEIVEEMYETSELVVA